MTLASFHPAVARWFQATFSAPTAPQVAAWPTILERRPTLIAAPTGSGKTLAAFLAALDDLFRQAFAGTLSDATQVLYVSPLKALSNDIQKNLQEPLAGIAAAARAMNLPEVEIRTLVRTGDTPQSERARMIRRPPHILVTTPESLYILLTSESGRRMLSTVRTVIVDEIHAVAATKRGSHLALSLARLQALTASSLLRIGLSATQRPVEEVARFLLGQSGTGDPAARCAIVDEGHRRALDLGVEIPGSPLEAVMSAEVWNEVYDRLAALVAAHRTTLVFVNTRRLSERVAAHLEERLGAAAVASHHGSLSRERRLEVEQRLKSGDLRCLVATASLELGIDIGSVDLVCQVGAVRAIASFLQRVGRAGHRLAALPKGRLFPLSRDELVESAALFDAVRRGELETLSIPPAPLDILAQQIVAECAAREWDEDGLFALVRSAWPYRGLERADFEKVLEMLSVGFTTRRGRRGAYLHRDPLHGQLRGRRGARLAAITSGGSIPDQGDFRVVEEPASTFVGTINEDFAIESLPGDVFQLGNVAWKVLKIEDGRVLVENARGAPPTLPFWLGEAPGRSWELSGALARLRQEVWNRLREGDPAGFLDPLRRADTAAWLAAEIPLPAAAAEQVVEYLAASGAALGAMPSQETLIVERFFDEVGDQHVVLHSPFGSRLNRAWGLALRKRFCRTFNFELQAAATEDAILLSLGPTHSFPLEDVFRFLHSSSVREVLVQAMLDSPLFGARWRWNASRALALLRFRAGRKVPPRLQRQEADDLSAVVFPDHLACPENLPGHRELPDHPLVSETVRDCLTEAMDIERLEALLASIERGERTLMARELTEPSPLAHEVVNARVFAFLDDAPLEERRTQAVQARRFLSPEEAADLGALDPAAIARVRAEAWPEAESPDELHDALMVLGLATAAEGEASGWNEGFEALRSNGRATRVTAGVHEWWCAAERWPEVRAIHPEAAADPEPDLPARLARAVESDAALHELVRGRLEVAGPITAAALAAIFALPAAAMEAPLAALESEGFVFRGHFSAPGEWCERRLLVRIHRLTLDRLRSEIEPVAPADYLRFLFAWQRVAAPERGEGPEALSALLEQLEGFEAPAAAWEQEILPARLKEYDPVWLDALCLSGRYAWARLTPPPAGHGHRTGPIKATPIALVQRQNLAAWRRLAGTLLPAEGELSAEAEAARGHLATRGASFFGEIAAATRLLGSQLEEALAELAAWGLVSADSFTGLRALLVPSNRRPPVLVGSSPQGAGRHRGSVAVFGMEHAGRWSLLEPATTTATEPDPELVARALLRRYGVVFRRVLERESLLPSWRDLLRVYRRLEARGELRGGRFVDGFSGEQYALPEAVGALRQRRRDERPGGDLLSISAADPLNLAGIATPGERLAALTGNRLLYRDGVPLGFWESGDARWLVPLEPAAAWQARQILVRRPEAPPALRAYLGRTA